LRTGQARAIGAKQAGRTGCAGSTRVGSRVPNGFSASPSPPNARSYTTGIRLKPAASLASMRLSRTARSPDSTARRSGQLVTLVPAGALACPVKITSARGRKGTRSGVRRTLREGTFPWWISRVTIS
jgi:hypothetical protein